mmetsp:Transcript_34138/g.76604  ORF Transcript_34138/g.76604 Transcript_34138/m.76604 type:complete len:316 (-) Transcript_34138:43-990(-)
MRGGPRGRGGEPTHLDLDCKAALQQLLRPSYYGVIDPWMTTASSRMKQDMVQLGRVVKETDLPGRNPYLLADVGKIQVLANPAGRHREANVIPVTADRVQADLLRNRSGAEQRDVRRVEKRRYMARYAAIPSTASVADFFQMSHAPIQLDPTMKVLTDRVRAKLQQWQVLGPEEQPHTAAEIVRGLRNLAAACERMPTYADYAATLDPAQAPHERLFGYSQAVPRGRRTLKELPRMSKIPLASSAPALLRPFLDPEEIDAIARPGGTVVQLGDKEPLQRMKNVARASQSQVQMSMGRPDWTTSSMDMAKDIAARG